jgi:hypothetical protein
MCGADRLVTGIGARDAEAGGSIGIGGSAATGLLGGVGAVGFRAGPGCSGGRIVRGGAARPPVGALPARGTSMIGAAAVSVAGAGTAAVACSVTGDAGATGGAAGSLIVSGEGNVSFLLRSAVANASALG